MKAGHCGGLPPLGYDVNDEGKLIINNYEAEAVKEIFRLYLTGVSYSRMADTLNAKGYKTKAGKPFAKNSFYGILTQQKYMGRYVWNRAEAKNSKHQRNNHAEKPVEEQIVIEGGCPKIIDNEIFEKANQKLKERAFGKSLSKSRYSYMLGGIDVLKCKACGAKMVGTKRSSHGISYTYYSCPNHKKKTCPTKDFRADKLEKCVSAMIVKTMLSRKDLFEINEIIAKADIDRNQEKKLKTIERKIANLTKYIEDYYTYETAERLNELEIQRNVIAEEIQKSKEKRLFIKENDLKTLRKNFINHLTKSTDVEVRCLLSKIIYEINVGNDLVELSLTV